MSGRVGWMRLAVMAFLLGLWLLPVQAQEQPPELEAIYKRGLQLYEAGKYAEAVPIAEEYIDVARTKFGEQLPHYATGLGYLGILYQALNRTSEAESLFVHAIEIKQKALGPTHPQVADALHTLAEFYRRNGRFAEAEPLYQRVLSIAEKMGPEQPLTGIALGNLAELYRAQGRHADAEPLAKRSIAIREKLSGAAQPSGRSGADETAYLLSLVTQLYQAGKYGEAIPIAERYVQVIEARHGTEGPEYALALNNLAQLLQETNRLADAEPLMRRAIAIDEMSLGPEHPNVAVRLNNLAQLLQATNRLADAEPLMRRALAIDEKSLDPEHPHIAIRLNNLAVLLEEAFGRYEESEKLKRRALAINEKSFGPEHPGVANSLNNLAQLLQATNRPTEAEPLMRRALAIDEKSFGPENPNVAIRLNNLAQLLKATNRLAEAEPLTRRGLAIEEKSRGLGHPNVAIQLNNLAQLLQTTNRFAEAEPLIHRALAIDEKSFGPEHPNVARDVNNLAELLRITNRLPASEPLYRRALAINEKSFGFEHLKVAINLNNLALLLEDTGRLVEAEPLYRRALAIFEKSLGPEHPDVANSLNNLAVLLQATNRLADAEPLMQRALVIDEKSLGGNHPYVARDVNNLAVLLAQRGDWSAAAALGRRAKPILVGRRDVPAGDRSGLSTAVLTSNTWAFRAHARAIYRAGAESNASREEGFELAQWALQTSAAQAISQMSARSAKGKGPLAQLVRERQDLVGRRAAVDKQLLAAVGRGDAPASEVAHKGLASLDAALDTIDSRLSSEFKDYAELANPQPLTIAAVQVLLNDGEALVLFLDLPQSGNLPGETLIWVVTKADARWVRIDLASRALAERAAALRCGLDRGAWEGEGKRLCLNLLAINVEKGPDGNTPLPFDLARAHQLYQALFGQVEDLIKGKHLLIVPSGPLTQLPFHVLVTDQPDLAAANTDAFRRAAWLAKSNAITVLPSVSSLKALREHAKTSHARKRFVGFGNPLLDGPDAGSGVRAEMSRAKQQCPRSPWQRFPGQVAGGMRLLQQRGGLADVATIRALVPLPETADELCAVAGELGVPDSDIWLGARANERDVKRLSDSGELAAYRIVHFATHGALAGELKAGAEPGLILTPPEEATPEDDGYLSASEIAGLKLDADWVILSACNTAAGGSESAEALSGMSRGFFYAGARALLVSHWAVDSDATVKLITKTLITMAADKTIGRSEALRRSMVALIERGAPHEAHPAYWAPFIVVGEGSAVELAAKPLATSSIIPEPQPPAKAAPSGSRPRPSKRVTPPNWRTQIWAQ